MSTLLREARPGDLGDESLYQLSLTLHEDTSVACAAVSSNET